VFVFGTSQPRLLTKSKTKSKSAKTKLKLAEGKKAKRKRPLKAARTNADPRVRMNALVQLDELAMSKADKGVVVVKADKGTVAHLERQAVHASDPLARLRAQDRLRELARSK
jgi:hypothetical protein